MKLNVKDLELHKSYGIIAFNVFVQKLQYYQANKHWLHAKLHAWRCYSCCCCWEYNK